MPPGRPPKYVTAEEKKAAANASKRESYGRNSVAISRRRKFKRQQKKSISEREAVHEDNACEPERHPSESSFGLLPTVPKRDRLNIFVEANTDSPAIPLRDFLVDEIDTSPSPTRPVASCQHWQKTVQILKGRQLGEFALKLLAIPDGEVCRKRLHDFESLLFAIDKIVELAGKIYDAAFQIDPSGTKGPVLEAKWLSRDVDMASLQLQEIVSLRRCSLESLEDFASKGLLEFQSVE